MNRLLRNKDYLRQIQQDNLLQIIESDYSILMETEQAAQSEMKSYLDQRYLTSEVFTNTSTFATSSTYYGKDLIEYTEIAYDNTLTYNLNDRVLFEGKIYISITASSITGISPVYTPDPWQYITDDLSLYYVTLPFNEWKYYTIYEISDEVWYQNIGYTALSQTQGVKPLGSSYWTQGSTYSISNTYPDDTTKWTKGDNRNQQLLIYLIDITLYHLHSRINPRNVPELRMIRYDGNSPQGHQSGGAIGWLKRVSNGEVNCDISERVPDTGISITWGNGDLNHNVF
jgi:hypothetical protein